MAASGRHRLRRDQGARPWRPRQLRCRHAGKPPHHPRARGVQLRRARGFTMVELVLVMVLVGVIAAIGVPRLMGDNSFDAAAFGDEVVSALRTAQKTAVARRRLVCANVADTAVTLGMASMPAATGCDIQLDADAWTTSAKGVSATRHTLYFQPNGLITSDTAGREPVRGKVSIQLDGNERRAIKFEGSTGYVQ
ncbi:MAG: prepilin-type N-terminal cleavage/methylation domain-containing protein [Telluria sp.]